ncbi:minor capsid protein [Nonomuraea sp. LPB2021202275-12-8]|uniref:minor capsid protein n=1 Tax=Nonomuraea sp. LPB2021202275-12-8 TaxID=3120159 RepID=UPI00300C9A2E
MTWTRALLSGLAEHLAASGAGVWHPNGIYASNEIAITIGGLPAAPDTALTLAVYGVGPGGDDPTEPDSQVLVQARIRAGQDPRIVDDLADSVFGALHGLSDMVLDGGVLLLQALRTVVAPLGVDGSGRWERADSYSIRVHRPSTHRPG